MDETSHWRRLRARLRSIGKDRYVEDGGAIHRYSDLRHVGSLRKEEVRRWIAHPEMTFDIVEIEDCGGRILRWFDYDGELVRLLQSATPAESPLL